MTNYNERQDEALALIKYSVEYRETHGGCPPAVSAIKRHGVAEAKQALTSLIKELVAEAKPERRDESVFASGYYAGGNGPVKNSYQVFSEGHNAAIDQFEQNLLKALSSSGKE